MSPSATNFFFRFTPALLGGCVSGACFGVSLAVDLPSTPTAIVRFMTGGEEQAESLARRLIELDPEHLSAADVRDVLAAAPAPRVILLNGSVPIVTMRDFADYLVAMGYPRKRLENPRDGELAQSSYTSSKVLAGELAWYYEHDAMMPMLIGHSQGGMLTVRTLHELAGEFDDAIDVWNPRTDAAEPRTTIVDPYTGRARPVVGLTVDYATALATGKLPRLLLGQWSMLGRLRKIPDTVRDFTGFAIPGDLIAGNLFGDDPYVATGTARVRNVELPASYSHIGLPQTSHLASEPRLRAWIESYVPGAPLPPAEAVGDEDESNLLHAADIWYSVKKHWCLASQRLARAALSRE